MKFTARICITLVVTVFLVIECVYENKILYFHFLLGLPFAWFIGKQADKARYYLKELKLLRQKKKDEYIEGLRESEAQYRMVVETSPNSIIIHQDNQIIYVNPSAVKNMGAASENQLIGKSLWQFIHPENLESVKMRLTQLLRGEATGPAEQKIITLDNRIIDIEVSTTEVTFDGKPALMSIAKDITDRKAENKKLLDVMKQLKESQTMHKTLFENANDIVVLFELNDDGQPTKFINVNHVACKKLGYSFSEFLSLSPIDISPKERLNNVSNLLSRILDEGHVIFEGGYITKSGTKIPFEFSASVLELNGKRAILSIGRDISERNKLLEKLTNSEKRYRNLVELAPVGIAIHQYGSFKYINPAGAKKLGAENPTQLLNKNILDFIHPDYHHTVKERWQTIRENNEPTEAFVGKMIRLDRKVIDVELSCLPFIKDGERFIQAFFKDITSQKETEKLMYQMAYYDSLTSLPNRRFLYDYLNKLITVSKQKNEMSALLFLDLDGFKSINDELGHKIGDLLLKQVADRLKRIIPQNGMASRFGGDEFIIVLEDINKKEVLHISSRLITAISKVYHLDGIEKAVTTSVGISLFPHNGNNAETLIKKADSAMYTAKELGKNRYYLYEEEQL